jgi:hypothetical protein
MEPTQRAALFHARMLCGLSTVTFPFSSSIVPLASDTCHSSALQVRASKVLLPNEAPEILVPVRALARLNPPRHDFELFPCLRRCSIRVFSQQIHPIKQHPLVQVSRQGYEPAVHRLVRNEL